MNDAEKIAQMQAQIEMLTQALGVKAFTKSTSDINDIIAFESVSLSPLYLSTEANGKGDTYKFDNFGDIQNVPIADARELVRHNKSFIQEGLVYIRDEDFIEKENLKKYYDHITDVDGLNNMLLCKRQEFGNRFQRLTRSQQEIVCGLLFDKLKNKKKVDEEILFYIQQALGKNIKEEVENLQRLIDNTDED